MSCGAFGRPTGRRAPPYGGFFDEVGPAVQSVVGTLQKDIGAQCSHWTAEVVKWQNAKPTIFQSSAKIATKLAEAKAEKARTCTAAEVARERAEELYSSGGGISPGSTAPTSSLSLASISPTGWLLLAVAGVAGAAWLGSSRRTLRNPTYRWKGSADNANDVEAFEADDFEDAKRKVRQRLGKKRLPQNVDVWGPDGAVWGRSAAGRFGSHGRQRGWR